MTEPTIYSREEFLAEAGVTSEELDQIEQAKIFSPTGRADKDTPYYDTASIASIRKIRGLLDLGYDLSEIARIRKKVGLPSQGGHGKGEKVRLLSVGELARRTGTSPRTIKHWEEKGIIEADSRSPGGFRLYRERYVFFCLLIRDLQLFGYTLDEIKEISDLFRDFYEISQDRSHFPGETALSKLATMRDRIDSQNGKMDQMEDGIRRWRGLLKQKRKQILAFEREIREKEARAAGMGTRAPASKTRTA